MSMSKQTYTYVQCEYCETSFRVTDGKLPAHRFNSKPCVEDWTEYDSAAEWCAKHKVSGVCPGNGRN